MYSKEKKMKFGTTLKLAMLSFVLLVDSASAAIVLEQQVEVSLGTEYNSNLQLLSNRDRESVYLYTITPEYTISALDGTNEWFASLGLNVEKSSNHKISRDREDPFATIGWTRDLERGMVGLVADYREQSSRSAQFTETGVVTQDGNSTNWGVTGSWSRLLTDKLDLALEAEYRESNFSGVADLAGYETRHLTSNWTYVLNEKVTPFLRVGVYDYRITGQRSGNNGRIKYQEYLAGAAVELSPKFSFNAGAGITRFSSSDENEWVGALGMEYLGGRYNVSSLLERTVYPTGIGAILLGDRFSVSYDYELSEKNTWGTGLVLSQNKTGLKTQEINGFYARELTPSWMMRVTLAARNLKRSQQSSVNGNSIGINFIYNTPTF